MEVVVLLLLLTGVTNDGWEQQMRLRKPVVDRSRRIVLAGRRGGKTKKRRKGTSPEIVGTAATGRNERRARERAEKKKRKKEKKEKKRERHLSLPTKTMRSSYLSTRLRTCIDLRLTYIRRYALHAYIRF